MTLAPGDTEVQPSFPRLVSVVIPARNAGALIDAQLEALSRQDYPGAWEVIIADNASTDDTARVAAGWAPALPGLRIVSADARPSVNHARNAGARAARGDVVLFCDADDVATPSWVRSMVDAIRGADIVGGYTDRTALNSARARAWRSQAPRGELPVLLDFLPFATGATLGVRAEVLRALGGFNEEYPGTGGDDVEFCWRAQLASYTLACAPDAVMCYRLRDRLWPLAKQAYGYGQAEARLIRQFRSQGLPARARGLRALAGCCWWLLRRLPELASRDRAGAWIFTASARWGRIIGCVRYRVFCP